MSVAMDRTAVVLLASGLSRRYGRRDKLLAPLGGKPLLEHMAKTVAGLDALVKVAVCPSDRKEIGERLIDRFVIALNKKPKDGLGHSIAVGVQVALQFKPDAMLFVMADMPFVEERLLRETVERLGRRGFGPDIVHSGGNAGVRPPTAFNSACFDSLALLQGDDGAKVLVRSGQFEVVGLETPDPLLFDIDTKEDLEIARGQIAIRGKYAPHAPLLSPGRSTAEPIDLGTYRAGPRTRTGGH